MHKKDFRERLISTEKPGDIIDVICSEEEKFFQN
jgi:hypothetical protein